MNGIKIERIIVGILSILLLLSLIIVAIQEVKQRRGQPPKPFISQEARECYECHSEKGISPIAIAEWQISEHAEKGIGCNECHIPSKEAGEEILSEKTLCADKKVRKSVSDTNCKRCHEKQVNEFNKSIHAYAIKNLNTASKFYNVTEVEAKGCITCHQIGEERKRCSSCHLPHSYSASFARSPKSCKSCHSETFSLFSSSLHGEIFFSREWNLSLELKEWKRVNSYPNAGIPPVPSCAVCHLPEGNHTVGMAKEIAFPVIQISLLTSTSKIPFMYSREKSTKVLNERKETLKKVCISCHPQKWVESQINSLYISVQKLTEQVIPLLEEGNLPYNPHLIPMKIKMKEPYLLIQEWSIQMKKTVHFGKGYVY